jgi:hypothetical protein
VRNNGEPDFHRRFRVGHHTADQQLKFVVYDVRDRRRRRVTDVDIVGTAICTVREISNSGRGSLDLKLVDSRGRHVNFNKAWLVARQEGSRMAPDAVAMAAPAAGGLNGAMGGGGFNAGVAATAGFSVAVAPGGFGGGFNGVMNGSMNGGMMPSPYGGVGPYAAFGGGGGGGGGGFGGGGGGFGGVRVRVEVACRGLPRLDLLSQSDAVVVCFQQSTHTQRFQYMGHTEVGTAKEQTNLLVRMSSVIAVLRYNNSHTHTRTHCHTQHTQNHVHTHSHRTAGCEERC